MLNILIPVQLLLQNDKIKKYFEVITKCHLHVICRVCLYHNCFHSVYDHRKRENRHDTVVFAEVILGFLDTIFVYYITYTFIVTNIQIQLHYNSVIFGC